MGGGGNFTQPYLQDYRRRNHGGQSMLPPLIKKSFVEISFGYFWQKRVLMDFVKYFLKHW